MREAQKLDERLSDGAVQIHRFPSGFGDLVIWYRLGSTQFMEGQAEQASPLFIVFDCYHFDVQSQRAYSAR